MFTTEPDAKIQLTEEENKLLVDICNITRLSYIMLYFHLLNKTIIIKYVNLSDENTAILLNLLNRIPVGFDMDGDAVILYLNGSRQRASLMYSTRTVAEF